MDAGAPDLGLDEVGLLADRVRRRLYDYIAAQPAPVSREDAANAAHLSRSLAAYHLDKLAAAGLLDVSYAHPEGRGGPGSGRPAKRYARSAREAAVSLPPRNYVMLANIIASAADAAAPPEFRTALAEAARREGRALGENEPDVGMALRTAGYEPVTDDEGGIVLRNCPFHSVVREHAELACGLNHAFVEGTLCGAGTDPARAELAPAEGRCCVVVHPETAAPLETATPSEERA
ncbi:helix-turn-helix domain-containing protein [Microbacterium pseudoresistens]|uniref:Putative ArsR family transcriptional regulator n=1 Tax=Microbacterium pseudoresistens TaxID=640634 RepID=A0A7Y9EU72_9MICO|nr:helix-turn-helix domain-containing protein [Microbacterium pseudoresistens]NYD54043.1 putative ArsR family transcriptional regulator [Microbacterium pseudoresistens]